MDPQDDRDRVAHNISLTVDDLAQKVRETVLASNSHAATEWAGALHDAATAFDVLAPNIDET